MQCNLIVCLSPNPDMAFDSFLVSNGKTNVSCIWLKIKWENKKYNMTEGEICQWWPGVIPPEGNMKAWCNVWTAELSLSPENSPHLTFSSLFLVLGFNLFFLLFFKLM